nr:Ubiquitin-specific protease incomplete domain containing protein [Pandoravirus aubagnensis]
MRNDNGDGRKHDIADHCRRRCCACCMSASCERIQATAQTNGLVHLNVRGTRMTTSRTTFDVAPRGSLVRRMFGTDAEATWAPVQLPDGSYFVDLNPRWFEAVLDVLRHGQSALSATKPEDRAGAACVADYLGIDLDVQPSATEPPYQRQLPTTTTVIVVGPGALNQCTRDLWDATEMRATETTYVKRIEVQTGLALCALRDALADATGLLYGARPTLGPHTRICQAL